MTDSFTQNREEIFKLISEQSLLGIVIIQDNRIQYANEAWATVTGFSVSEMCAWAPDEFLQRVHPDDRQTLLEQSRKKQSEKADYRISYDWRLIARNGDIRWISMYSRTIEFNNRTANLATLIDNTKSKHMMQALQESEEKYRTLVENATDAIFIAQDNAIKFPNPETAGITGYSVEELSRLSLTELVHPADREMVGDRYQRRLKGEQLPKTYAFRTVTKSGETVWVQLNVALIRWEGRPATLNVIRNINRQKKIEDQLLQAQKMKSIGTLAGGIAHDFNNLLMGILGRVSLMQTDIDSTHPHYDHFKNIEDYIKSATDLTRQLLGFARGGKYETKPSDINEIIERSASMFARTKKEIEIERKLSPDVWAVAVDPGQIEQVLLNLYVNAWQAMPGGGNIYIETENILLDEDQIGPHQISRGHYVKTSITDTGVGMDERIRSRIFDPFFTTKKMGRGTGLGLASAYGIIKNHSGMITVYSEPGKGATFNIYLPATDKAVVQTTEIVKQLATGSGTILLVDDEQIIIEVGQSMLEKLGYTVIIATNGYEAVNIVSEKRKHIDLVILDMIMPEMSGSEVFEKFKEMDVDFKILLSSGYSMNGQASQILDKGCDGFIQKPFNIHILSEKIQELLQA